jgi:hypothetical protein
MSVFITSVLVLAVTFSTAKSVSATTYYVSTSGSDTNNGTTKTTPWAHLPGMANAAGSASSYSAVGGDTFILMGCDIWYNASFPIQLNHGGSSGHPVTITVDKTWYDTTHCPTTWNRPVFDGHLSATNSTNVQIGGSTSGCVGGAGNEFVAFNASYITLDNVEMRNLFYANDAENSCYGGNSLWQVSNADYVTVSNSYEHAWRMGTYSPSTSNDTDTLVFVVGTPLCPHCLMDHNVADNCDATSGTGTQPGGALNMTNVTHSYFACMSNAYKPTVAGEFGWNEITKTGASPDTTIHPNCIETLMANGTGVYYIHDNRVHDNYECEGLQVGNPGETDYVWNNLWYHPLDVGANGPQVPQSETPVSMHFWNNTVIDWGDCINDASHGYSWSGAFYSQNNLCINSSGTNSSGSPTGSSVTISNNIGLTDTQAATAGYAGTQALVYSPSSSSSPTVGAGVNLTALWPAQFSTLDASLVCTRQTVNTVIQVVCTGTPNARPVTGPWDAGAYQFSAGTASQPNPPTGLKAIVQ